MRALIMKNYWLDFNFRNFFVTCILDFVKDCPFTIHGLNTVKVFSVLLFSMHNSLHSRIILLWLGSSLSVPL